MDEKRMASMIDNVVGNVDEYTFTGSKNFIASPNENENISNIDMAIDNILASFKVINSNLEEINVDSIPEKAAVDAIKDLMDTAIMPYFSDVLKAMQVFGS